MPVSDWRKPTAKLKKRITDIGLAASEVIGRYERRDSSDLECTSGEQVNFLGDVPKCAGANRWQHRIEYTRPRPAYQAVRNLLYTPQGHAWHEGTLKDAFSIRQPTILDLLRRPRAAGKVVREAYVIESETPYTYGDWVGDFIRALVELPEYRLPVVLPEVLAEKSYVQRDLARLGLELISSSDVIEIEKAHVLHKTLPSYYWGPKQVAAYRQCFDIVIEKPRPGSLIYLSRAGVQSEAIDRAYPSETIAEIVQELGGSVFDTRKASPKAFEEISMEAETVIADQGSAVFGVLQWGTKNLIEITNEDWWHNANLFFSHASGVEKHALLVNDRYDSDETKERLRELLREIGY